MQPSSRSFFSVLVFVFAAAGCSALDGSSSSTAETAALAAVAPATESGTATLTDTDGSSTQIAITTANGTDTGAQSSVIRTGTCGSNGAVFAILNNVQSDESITTVAYALSSLEGSKYYIDISSSTDVDTVVACGEIP